MIIKPNYKKSIINLMSSIQKSLGVLSLYNELEALKHCRLRNAKNIILIVIDGLGYDYLTNESGSGIMIKHLKDKLTSVFLATTATSITSFLTGLAPNKHAITGWRIYLKEIGIASELMSFNTRSGKIPFDKFGLKIKDFFDGKGIFSKTKTGSYLVYPKNLAYSQFSSAVSEGATTLPFNNLGGLFNQVRKAINLNDRRKYIYAYWQAFDSVCHKYGTKAKETQDHFKEIEHQLEIFLNSINNKDFVIIITSDHGLIDFNRKKIIKLENHPELLKMLVVPLCGEARVAYCYVRPDKARAFEKYVEQHLKKYCWVYKSKKLAKDGWFGPFSESSRFLDRIGDYTLIMKNNYIIQDKILGEPAMAHFFKACHGGVSEKEMYVPLIVIDN